DRFGFQWSAERLPIDAARYSDRVGLHEPMLNDFNFGGYLMWARPDPVFIDGRVEVFGEAFLRSYMQTLSRPEALEAAVERYRLGWIILSYVGNRDLLARLSRDPHWRLAYWDHVAVIFVRSEPGSERYVDPALATESTEPSEPVLDTLPGIDGTPRPGRLAR